MSMSLVEKLNMSEHRKPEQGVKPQKKSQEFL